MEKTVSFFYGPDATRYQQFRDDLRKFHRSGKGSRRVWTGLEA
jgi:hypothetical protein